MDLLQETAIVQDLEVATDRHVGHAELADQVRHPHATVLPDALQDQGLALTRQHDATTVRARGNFGLA
jgi:hypothetical protein